MEVELVFDGYSLLVSIFRNLKLFFLKLLKVVEFVVNGFFNISRVQYVELFEFGIIFSYVMKQINDQENFKLRV